MWIGFIELGGELSTFLVGIEVVYEISTEK